MTNTLYYGDNLPVLRRHIADESVDLVYLDPPFNSNRDYNVLFKEQGGDSSPAQIKAFTDTWRWNEEAFHDFVHECPRPQLVDLVSGFVNVLGRNDVTAYLVMMAPRLVELHRALKPTGSLYLHCDPTASHYLKLLLDCIFGPVNFRNEIIWKRTHSHGGSRRYGPIHDTIFFFTKGADYTWNPQHTAYSDDYKGSFFKFTDPDGRRYRSTILTGSGTRNGSSGKPWRGIDPTLVGRHWAVPGYVRHLLGDHDHADVQSALDALDKLGRILWPAKEGGTPSFKQYIDDLPGVPLQDIINDIPPISSQAAERLGYPTQKPLALLERILQASSNEGDVVLDPFAGCGTAVMAAEKLNRQWVGIDITHLATALIKYRLSDAYGLQERKDYIVIGEPTTASAAAELAQQDRDEFQKWAIGLVPRAKPYQDKKGADSGIDGIVYFNDDPRTGLKKSVIQVKSGHVGAAQVRDFRGVIEREKAVAGLFVTLANPTGPMLLEADSLGFYTSPLNQQKVPRMQIRTVEQLLEGAGFQLPGSAVLSGVGQGQAMQSDPGQGQLQL